VEMVRRLIRKASIKDLDNVMEIALKLVHVLNNAGNYQWNEFYPLKEHFLEDVKNGDLYIAYQEDEQDPEDSIKTSNTYEILGFIAITTDQPPEYSDLDWNNNSKVAIVPHRIGVSPFVQGKGTAQLLMSHVEVVARERNISCIRVDTNILNLPMQHIFTKLDYSYIGNIFVSERQYGMLEYKCYQKFLE
jgi:ribosomal protein S18 acetylase RimI-like enzyme